MMSIMPSKRIPKKEKKFVLAALKDEARMQVDFLIRKEKVTSRHNISPIEVKSGTNYTLTSLRKCIKKFGPYLSTPYVLHTKDVETKEGIVYPPLYMTPLL